MTSISDVAIIFNPSGYIKHESIDSILRTYMESRFSFLIVFYYHFTYFYRKCKVRIKKSQNYFFP